MMRFMIFLLFALPLIGQQVEITLHGTVPLDQFSLDPNSGNDIWGFTDATGRDYAIMGVNNGTAVFDITDPANPIEVGSVPGPSSTWRDVKTYIYDDTPGSFSAYAFVTTEANAGLQIIDLSQVPASISLAATYTGGGLSTAHNIFISPEPDAAPFAYILGANQANGGVIVLDISDPVNPVEVGRWSDFYTHDFYLGTNWADPNYDGKEIGVAFCGSNNISLIDFSDKANPQLIEDYQYPNIGYSHSGWAGVNGRYLYACDEFDEQQLGLNTSIYIFDLLDMTQPELVGTWTGPTRAVDHNAFVKDSYLHVANYARGYTLLDLSDPVNPMEAGNHDTFPDNNNANFNGAWGAFPYYDSGLVVVSDQSAGLIVLEPELAPGFRFSLDPGTLAACQGQNLQTQANTWSISGFDGAVTFSADGVPAGVDVVFSANPVSPGDTFSVTFEVGAGAATGIHAITLTGQAAGAETRTRDLVLEIQGSPDEAPQPQMPEDGSNCTGVSDIMFQWVDSGFGRGYRLEIASDLQFTDIVFAVDTQSNSHMLTDVLAENEVHYWRVRSTNACGDSTWSNPLSFRTANPPILLVDDDDNNPDVRPYYTNLLDEMGITYSIFEVETPFGDGPHPTFMGRFDLVIWFSGDKFGTPARSGPTTNDEIALTQYLDNGGKLLLSAQDYRHDMGVHTPFMTNVLGVSEIDSDAGSFESADGVGSLSQFGNFSLNPSVGSEYYDIFTAGTGELVMSGNNGQGAAVRTDNTLFLAFTFATLIDRNPQKARDLLEFLALEYGITNCRDLEDPCFVLDMEGDGFDMDDLRLRLPYWNEDESLLSLISYSNCL